jgi:integrase/recombinase XerC
MQTSQPNQYLQQFLNYLSFEKRFSAHTIRAYNDDLHQFCLFLKNEFDEICILNAQSTFIRTWLASLKQQKLTAKSINRKTSSLRSFFKYHLRVGNITATPLINISTPKISKRLPQFVKEEEMALLLTSDVFPDTWQGSTDRLLINIFYQTGMRLSELIYLKESQLNIASQQIRVLGKGNKERIIPVNNTLLHSMQEYIGKKSTNQYPNIFLLVNEKGKPLYPRYAYNAVNKYLAIVTTLQKKSPHILRHSFATHLTNHGADLNAIKELLGHSSLAATQVYTHNSIEKLKKAFKNAHPKA